MKRRNVTVTPEASLAECAHLANMKRRVDAGEHPSFTSFKAWSEARGYHYETARKLAAIGAAPDPAIALRQSRERNMVNNRNRRDAVSRETKEPSK